VNIYSFICGMRSRDYSKEATIFESSLQIIERDGIAGLTMAKIANAANLATGTLYIYFTNKEELIHELYRKLERESVHRFLAGYSEKIPFKESLKKVWLNYLNHRITYHAESVFLEQYYRSPYISEPLKHIAESMKLPVHKIIRRGIEEGVLSPKLDERMVFLAMLGFIRELADEHVGGVYVLDNVKIESAFELSWNMIKA